MNQHMFTWQEIEMLIGAAIIGFAFGWAAARITEGQLNGHKISSADGGIYGAIVCVATVMWLGNNPYVKDFGRGTLFILIAILGTIAPIIIITIRTAAPQIIQMVIERWTGKPKSHGDDSQ